MPKPPKQAKPVKWIHKPGKASRPDMRTIKKGS